MAMVVVPPELRVKAAMVVDSGGNRTRKLPGARAKVN